MKRLLQTQHVVTSIRRASTRRATPKLNTVPSERQAVQSPTIKPAEKDAKPQAEPASAPAVPPPPPPKEKITPNQMTPSRAIPWALASLFAGGLGFYLIQLYVAATQPCTDPAIASLAAQKDVSARYDETADSFDSEVGLSEMLMGINGLRKKLARQCRGHVLEASCGTGRNLGYFDLGPGSKVESLTFVDLSPQMVEVCRRKWDVLVGAEKEGYQSGRLTGRKYEGLMKRSLVVRFLTGSVLGDMPPPPAITTTKDDDSDVKKTVQKKKYTTILQTMGLCSTPSPHALLSSLAAHLDTSDPSARILLLEHGRSYMPWLNRILDNSAAKHAEIHGCWYNRDIGVIVKDAAGEAGLEVKRVRRKHAGTTWVFELGATEKLLEESKKREGVAEAQVESRDGSAGGWKG